MKKPKLSDLLYPLAPKPPDKCSKAELELLLMNAFPKAKLHAALLVMLQRSCLYNLRRYGDGFTPAKTLLHKVNKLLTKPGYGEHVGTAIDAQPDPARVWLMWYKIHGCGGHTAKELQTMAENTSAPRYWRVLLDQLEIDHIKAKSGPVKGTKYRPRRKS